MNNGELRRVALIPARGGSKRLPRKNVLTFRGRPIIAYTINAARESGLFDRVVVSTDSEEIAEVARKEGALTARRPAHLALDQARVVDVALDFLDREHSSGNTYDQLVVLYATAPLRAADDVRGTVSLLARPKCNFALAVSEYESPPHQALALECDLFLRPRWPDLVNRRTDEVGRSVVDNGSTYAVDVPSFLAHRTFYGPGLRGHLMPRERSVDIDTALDFDLALFFAARLEGTQ